MPRLSKLSRSKSIQDATITSSSILEFLAPTAVEPIAHARRRLDADYVGSRRHASISSADVERYFYTALSQVTSCHTQDAVYGCQPPLKASVSRGNGRTIRSGRRSSHGIEVRRRTGVSTDSAITINGKSQRKSHEATRISSRPHKSAQSTTSNHLNPISYPPARLLRYYHTQSGDVESKQRRFAEGSRLPSNFFDDISVFRNLPIRSKKTPKLHENPFETPVVRKVDNKSRPDDELHRSNHKVGGSTGLGIIQQMKLIGSVRELEEKLERAKKELSESMSKQSISAQQPNTVKQVKPQPAVVLTKEDYMNLVDLYYYSHNTRFSPESIDKSPTPLVLDDYSFTLSADFTPGAKMDTPINEDENYESPLKQIEEMLKQNKLHEIAVLQVFVDLLLDEWSSNRALYEAYGQLPKPGVAYLPKGIVRLFLQRMSTPWTLSEKSMLRYLSLIDDMQKAEIPITVSEWSSAVYLAGRAFSKVHDDDVSKAFRIWKSMEHEAGVEASHVTFNILFDIAVRSGKFALGETILREMHSRDLRLNRLGRVSLMYYHGLRRDGDGVRKAYRDFVDAGEIVDTLVLNCVISSLLNAQEPQAAEQIYARMLSMQAQLQKGFERNGEEVLYKRYPDPGTNRIEQEMASNHLNRTLLNASRLLSKMPEHHRELQAAMPLRPDHTTFRSMISYHATTSGDLDRITVLLNEMTEVFELPLQAITFQLLFKGFAIHGPRGGPHSAWSTHRLDLCWDACRAAIKESETSSPKSPAASATQTASRVDFASKPTLPSINQINAVPQHEPLPDFNPPLSRPSPRRLSAWSEFVLDLAAFPRERLKRLERFHATMFDAEDMAKPHEKPGPHTFNDPFFQQVAYTAPEPKLDTEEGEYELPNPSEPGLLHREKSDSKSEDIALEKLEDRPHEVTATRILVCWLLRAYARNTKSRRRVEEVWGQIRKVFKPAGAEDQEAVLRVLRRCLRDCDREGSG